MGPEQQVVALQPKVNLWTVLDMPARLPRTSRRHQHEADSHTAIGDVADNSRFTSQNISVTVNILIHNLLRTNRFTNLPLTIHSKPHVSLSYFSLLLHNTDAVMIVSVNNHGEHPDKTANGV